MSNFSFGSFAQVQAPVTTHLKPYTINDNVTIKSTEIKEGTSKDGKPWKKLDITFGNDEGIYSDSTFFLDINDLENVVRKEVDASNGGKRVAPSRWDQVSYKLSAIGRAFAPDLIDKFNSVVGKCKTFEDFIKAYKTMIDKVANKTTTSMKLTGRNSNGTIYATLPSCVAMAQATTAERAAANGVNVNDWYPWMKSPFGDNLTFTAYEMARKEELSTAAPTKPTEIEAIDTPASKSSDDVDFDALLS